MKSRMIVSLTLLVLAACTEAAPKTLDEKLVGKTPEERQDVLRLECLNEAEDIGNRPRKRHLSRHAHIPRDSEQTQRLKNICRDMADAYSPTDSQGEEQ